MMNEMKQKHLDVVEVSDQRQKSISEEKIQSPPGRILDDMVSV